VNIDVVVRLTNLQLFSNLLFVVIASHFISVGLSPVAVVKFVFLSERFFSEKPGLLVRVLKWLAKLLRFEINQFSYA